MNIRYPIYEGVYRILTLKRYFVKQHGHIAEYYAIDKTALRSVLYGRIEDIVEVELKSKKHESND